MEKITARQNETVELCFKGKEPTGSHVSVDLTAAFSRNGETVRVKGFYAGDGAYKVRFLPERSGDYTYTVTGEAIAESVTGTLEVLPTDASHHGPVRADGTHLRYADGTLFHSFGTTVYALAHQSDLTLYVVRIGVENRMLLPNLDRIAQEGKFPRMNYVINGVKADYTDYENSGNQNLSQSALLQKLRQWLQKSKE